MKIKHIPKPNEGYVICLEEDEGGRVTETRIPYKNAQVRPETQPHGLGDWTEQQLQKLGITQERWKAIKQRFGLAPTCGCTARKNWLNKVSEFIKRGQP